MLFPNEIALSFGYKSLHFLYLKSAKEKSTLPFLEKRMLPLDIEKFKNAVFGKTFFGRKQRKFNVYWHFHFPKTKDLGRKFIPKTFLADFWEHFWENHALKIQKENTRKSVKKITRVDVRRGQYRKVKMCVDSTIQFIEFCRNS